MSVDSVRKFFETWNLQNQVMEFPVSSATVEKAAEAVGCEGKRIAKTMSFKVAEQPILVVMAGDAKVDNHKYKEQFHTKAVMLKGDEVEGLTGHPIGGVCPFAVKAGVEIYLDESLRRFDTVFPACGSSNSAIELTLEQLETCSGARGWVEVSKLVSGL